MPLSESFGVLRSPSLRIGRHPSPAALAQVEWSVEYYDVLQNTVGGGKPKMNW